MSAARFEPKDPDYAARVRASFARQAAMAIAFGKRACAHLHRQAHEVHAGVGFILEHDLTLYSRRAKYWEHNLGDARFWDEQVAVTLDR